MPHRALPALRSLPFALCLALAGCGSLRPSNTRDWSADQAVLSYAELRGEDVKIYNVRNCDYRTKDDYTVRYDDRVYHLDELSSVDLIVVPFRESPALAHTMLSFGFADEEYLTVSIEIRKEKGEKYEPLAGVLQQFELMYVVGDERDLLGLRANHRLDDVLVYRLRATPQEARALFEDVLARVNKLYAEPEFYHTLANNCTTNIRDHINRVVPGRIPYDYRVLLPGYTDDLAYDLGLLATEDSFLRTRERARINELAYRYRDDPNFSRLIRR